MKQRWRGDLRHRQNAGFQKSDWRKTKSLPHPYDLWKLRDWDYLTFFTFFFFNSDINADVLFCLSFQLYLYYCSMTSRALQSRRPPLRPVLATLHQVCRAVPRECRARVLSLRLSHLLFPLHQLSVCCIAEISSSINQLVIGIYRFPECPSIRIRSKE